MGMKTDLLIGNGPITKLLRKSNAASSGQVEEQEEPALAPDTKAKTTQAAADLLLHRYCPVAR